MGYYINGVPIKSPKPTKRAKADPSTMTPEDKEDVRISLQRLKSEKSIPFEDYLKKHGLSVAHSTGRKRRA